MSIHDRINIECMFYRSYYYLPNAHVKYCLSPSLPPSLPLSLSLYLPLSLPPSTPLPPLSLFPLFSYSPH